MTGQIAGVRQPTVLDEIIARSDEFELAAPPPALDRQKLGENTYRVVGEAERGRSTFVNQTLMTPRRTNQTRVRWTRNWRRT